MVYILGGGLGDYNQNKMRDILKGIRDDKLNGIDG